MEAIVLAGGLGTRLQSRLKGLPKPMAPISGTPFLAILLNQLAGAGMSRVILSVGYGREYIIDHFRESYCGLALTYAVEESPLGTGGAIRQALTLSSEKAVFVMNGDTYVSVNFHDMAILHQSTGQALTMAIAAVADVSRYGGIVLDQNRVAGFDEKGYSGPGWINAGVYVLQRDFAWPPDLRERFSFEQHVLPRHIADSRPEAYRVAGKFIDIGIPEDFDRAQIELLDQ